MQQKHLERYIPAQQRDLNLVRMYLQVHTLVDMSRSGSRTTTIDLNCPDAKRPPDFEESSAWPRQKDPSKAQRRLWKGFLKSSYLRYVPYWIQDPLVGPAHQAEAVSTSQPPVVTFSNQLDRLPKHHQRLIEGYQQKATDNQLWKAFRSKQRLHMASDGGLYSQQGTHGWVLSTGSRILLKCAGPVDGPRDTSSSTRSELGG
jgi:hypothetical protein